MTKQHQGRLPAQALDEKTRLMTVDRLRRVNAEGTFYTLEYGADYKLDELLKGHVTSVPELTDWVMKNLLAASAARPIRPGGGCSAFVLTQNDGKPLFARNYDFFQNAQNVLVHCAPRGGYQSVAMTACGWFWNGGERLDDGKTDLSMLVAAPYLLMDGMNEKGLCVCTLLVEGAGTAQKAAGRDDIMTTVAMRLALDRAATVDEAVELLKSYNMHAAMPNFNFHFLLADASGARAIVEYAPGGELRVDRDEHRLVTNFYLLFPSAEYGYDNGTLGRDRYDRLKSALDEKGYRGDAQSAMRALSLAYQDCTADGMPETQWSLVYDPVKLKALICPRVNQADPKEAFYQTQYMFDLNPVFESGLDSNAMEIVRGD